MSRGGFRQGAGRKKEYTEPVKKILLGLPESVLEELWGAAVLHTVVGFTRGTHWVSALRRDVLLLLAWGWRAT